MTSTRWLAGSAAALVLALSTSALVRASSPDAAAAPGRGAGPAIYSFTVKNNAGATVPLSRYKGKVLLIVNTASLCGNTPQYASLEKLYQTYRSRGLRILAFPEDDFANQEPGNNKQIRAFCTSRYHVTFDLFSKIDVDGPSQAPLYTYLTSPATDPKFGKPIEWNFAKFLIGRDGAIVARFPAGHDPESPDVVAAIETALAKPA